METLFEELKRYVGWGPADEAALRALHPGAAPELERIASIFYQRILDHAEARKALDGKTIAVSAKAGSAGRLFGSVTSKEVAAAIKTKCGFDIDRRKIVMASDIKTFGAYPVETKLHPGIAAKLTIVVGEEQK